MLLSPAVDYARFALSRMSRTAQCCPEIDLSGVMGWAKTIHPKTLNTDSGMSSTRGCQKGLSDDGKYSRDYQDGTFRESTW